MIIVEDAHIDNSDAVSTNTLVAEPAIEDLPRFFKRLVYASSILSIVPFVLSLVNITQSKLFSVPTILAYVLTTPFHLAASLLVFQHSRQINMRLPFNATSLKTLCSNCVNVTIWLAASVICAVGARHFEMINNNCGMGLSHSPCLIRPRTIVSLAISSVISALEALILLGVTFLSFQSRRQKRFSIVSTPTSIMPKPAQLGV